MIGRTDHEIDHVAATVRRRRDPDRYFRARSIGNFSLIEVAELQFDYILQLIEQVRSGQCREIAATTGATRDFNEELAERVA